MHISVVFICLPHVILKGTSEPQGGYAGLGKCGIFSDEIKNFLTFSLRKDSMAIKDRREKTGWERKQI